MANERNGLCPVCGIRVYLIGTTADGRLIGECKDAFTREQWEACERCGGPNAMPSGLCFDCLELMLPKPDCVCGSGEYPEAIHDARGIYVCRACSKCRKEKLAGYRPEIFTDSNYEHDEPIDEE